MKGLEGLEGGREFGPSFLSIVPMMQREKDCARINFARNFESSTLLQENIEGGSWLFRSTLKAINIASSNKTTASSWSIPKVQHS